MDCLRPVPPDDRELIEAFCLNGDRQAFEQLITRYLGQIDRNLIILFRGNVEDAADARQEVLVKLYRGLDRFRFKSSFSTYLYRLTRNTAIDLLRKKGRERKHQQTVESGLALVALNEADSNPLHDILKTEKRERILRGIMKLGTEDRNILYLKDGEGLSLAEISKITGKPLGTLKSRLHRVRKKAANLLEELLDEE